jgi:1,4-alpha-glucan branching enzyme
MGGEIGQWNEWNCSREIEWILLSFPTHQGIQTMVKEINHLYASYPAFWEKEFQHDSFEWVDFHDSRNSVISYLRKGDSEELLCIHNFTPHYHGDYIVYFGRFSKVEEVFNSDHMKYGGSGKLNLHPEILRDHYGYTIGLKICLAPLATMIFKLN